VRTFLSPKWLLSHLFVVFMVALMTSLGFWQLSRLAERKDNNELIRAAAAAPAAPVEDLLADVAAGDPPLDHHSVVVSGSYRADLSFLVANRTFDSQPGSWLATPIELDNGELVVVARGWVPRLWVAGSDPRPIDTPAGPVEVTGRIFASVGGGRIGTGTDDFPEVSRIDLEVVAEAIGAPVAARWVQLGEQTPAQTDLPVPVPPPVLDDGPHLSYAFQWFFFSVGTVVAYVLILRRRASQPDA